MLNWLEPDAFSYYDVTLPGWLVDPGRYVIEIGHDSRHIERSETVVVRKGLGSQYQKSKFYWHIDKYRKEG